MRVFVKNINNESLMPCKSSKARKLLNTNKAHIINYKPFTIKLNQETSNYIQKTTLGIDTGMRNIGVAIIINNQKVIAKGEIELRQNVKTNIDTRRIYRRSRRTRKTRYREQRFQNRKRKKSWLPPSIQSRIDNTIFWIEKFQSLLPNNTLNIELGKFDPHKMINPDIKGKDYQMGQTAGYYDVRHFVFERDNYTCQVCKKSKDKILNTHHIVYTSKGGTNNADNLITVCTDCHTSENHKPGNILHNWMINGKKVKQYKAPTFMNIVRERFYQHFEDMNVTYGSTTKPKRKELDLDKTHFNDAIAITNIDNNYSDETKAYFKIKQFRKKKRSLHEATARKGRKTKNRNQKRNSKNTKKITHKKYGAFYLNDKVEVFGKVGFVSGFTGSGVYVKDIDSNYITISKRNYKQVNLKHVKQTSHNNNWQFIPHLSLSALRKGTSCQKFC
ncbi:MAG: RNA-guided endonuclease IscB [Bacillota bacterium]|nr:RNA-guided endonuclease IscB [Bacillota bacterium]